MCGIAGIAYTDRHPVERDILEKMTRTLEHRGPDDEGIKILSTPGAKTSNSNGHVGFGHRRLSIIDLSENGRQPMANEDGTVWITFNGEIYNFKELKQDLIGHGHVFQSESDTEVIIHGYEQYGHNIFNKLNGMFAFGLWDGRKQELFLVRDRYGQKPLYYWPSTKGIAFASELKSLIQHPSLQREIDIHSLSRYLAYEYVPAPHAIFKGVKKLLPGQYLRWKDAAITLGPYWEIQFTNTETTRSLPICEIERQLIHLLKLSVKRRLVSDVPLGVFLSGGIDSSSIVAMMSELIPCDQIKTFSIGFEDQSFDEASYAQKIARYFGTDHHERLFTHREMAQVLPEVCGFLDEPFADPSVLPTSLLSKFTRESVTVALGGDGGDELFAGYDPFLAHRLARYYERVPRFIHDSVVSWLVSRLPVSTKNMSFDFKAKQFLKGVDFAPPVRNQVWLGAFSKDEQKGIFTQDTNQFLGSFDPYEDIEVSRRNKEFRDSIDEIIFLYSWFYLSEDILTKVDRASMAASLEVRSPYLDVEFAEFANSIPSNLKLRGLNRKYILKRSLEKKLPKEILYRKKKGFGIPLAKWLRRELKPTLLDVFSPSRIRQEGRFKIQAIEALLGDHFDGKKDNRKQIWTLLVYEMWRERFA